MNRIQSLFATSLLSLFLSATLSADQSEDTSEPISREETSTIEFVATLSAIDYETREIDLTDSQGNVRSLTVDPRVKRFSELKVGDQVNVDIVASTLAEVREPTEAELQNPDQVKRGVVRSQGEGALTGSMTEAATVVVTIVGLNLLYETITVMTNNGELVDVQAQSVDNLKKLRLGDTIVVTVSQSIAVSVEPITSVAEVSGSE